MCMQMMSQRQEIEADIKREVERCEASIRENGMVVSPFVIINLETLFIANKNYFEENGFEFEANNRMENDRLRYYAIMRPSFNGKMAEDIRRKLQEAKKDFVMRQRMQLQSAFNQSFMEVKIRRQVQVLVNMREIMFENKAYFEDEGYYFEPKPSSDGDDSTSDAWMRSY